MKTELLNKEQVLELAKQIALEKYGEIDNFNSSLETSKTHWIVYFEDPKITEDGKKQHFSIWIDKKNNEHLFFMGR